MKQYQIDVYQSESGAVPFQEWLDGLKDAKAKTAVVARLGRAALGNFGDWKPITGVRGLCEMRIHYGQGFRVLYALVQQDHVLLLTGTTKRGQNKALAKAKEYLVDFKQRVEP